jgi:hypothetical protein
MSKQSKILRRMEQRALEKGAAKDNSLNLDAASPPNLLASVASTPLELKVPATPREIAALPQVLLGNVSHGLKGEWPMLAEDVRDIIALMLADIARELVMRATSATPAPPRSHEPVKNSAKE